MVKFCETLGKTICRWLEDKLKDKLQEHDLKDVTDSLLLATNVADAYGGGPLWAVDGIACVAHGRSKAVEITRCMGQAKLAVERDLVSALKKELSATRAKLNSAE